MRHRSKSKHFNRTPAHRRAMIRNVAAGLLRTDFNPDDPVPGPGRIITTPQKAKECRRLVEKLVTLAKAGGVANFRKAFGMLGDKEMVRKLFNDIAPRYAGREGGYTRILHLAEVRLGDAAPQCIFELVEEEVRKKPSSGKASGKRAAKAAAAEKPAGPVESQARAEEPPAETGEEPGESTPDSEPEEPTAAEGEGEGEEKE